MTIQWWYIVDLTKSYETFVSVLKKLLMEQKPHYDLFQQPHVDQNIISTSIA